METYDSEYRFVVDTWRFYREYADRIRTAGVADAEKLGTGLLEKLAGLRQRYPGDDEQKILKVVFEKLARAFEKAVGEKEGT